VRAECPSTLVDMPNDDVSPVDIGTDAAPQLHIIEMDNGHSTLAFKRRKAFRGSVYDHLGCDGGHVQKSTGCLGSLGVIAIIPSERQQRKLASQVTKSSIASSVLIFERPPPPLNGEAIASPLNNPSKPNVTQTAFSVIEISPTSL
jgi:hypothetical protein